MDVGQRPLGASARRLRLRAAVLRLHRRAVRLHAGLLVAAGSRAERLAGSRASRWPSADRRAARGLAHAASARWLASAAAAHASRRDVCWWFVVVVVVFLWL